MDRGIPTEAVLAELRAQDSQVKYLVGTPKGRLTQLEKELADKPWQAVRPHLRVKLLPHEGEVYVLAQSGARTAKERALRRRKLPSLWQRLREIQRQALTRDQRLAKLGAARDRAGRAVAGLVLTTVDAQGARPSASPARNCAPCGDGKAGICYAPTSAPTTPGCYGAPSSLSDIGGSFSPARLNNPAASRSDCAGPLVSSLLTATPRSNT